MLLLYNPTIFEYNFQIFHPPHPRVKRILETRNSSQPHTPPFAVSLGYHVLTHFLYFLPPNAISIQLYTTLYIYYSQIFTYVIIHVS